MSENVCWSEISDTNNNVPWYKKIRSDQNTSENIETKNYRESNYHTNNNNNNNNNNNRQTRTNSGNNFSNDRRSNNNFNNNYQKGNYQNNNDRNKRNNYNNYNNESSRNGNRDNNRINRNKDYNDDNSKDGISNINNNDNSRNLNNNDDIRNNDDGNINDNKRADRIDRIDNDFWNDKMVEYLICNLSLDQQVYKPLNQNSEQIVIDEMGQTLQTKKRLPSFLLDLGVSNDFIENSLIYQVDTVYSAWHSILALISPDYLLLDYNQKCMSVQKFRDTVNNEFINNPKLRNDILERKIRLVHVENSIMQEKIQDDVLLRFFAIFFDVNIYLIDDNSCYVYHNMLDFTGKSLSSKTLIDSCDKCEAYNPYKASLLLYRFPYGNIAPVLRENHESQILCSKTDSDFILPLSTRFLQTKDTTVTEDREDKRIDKDFDRVDKDFDRADNAKKAADTKKEKEKDKFLNTMLKLKWDDLATLAEKEQIKPLQAAVKGFNSWKKKTKQQIADELWEALYVN